jgi:multiple sugar transport system ATP-binding protein
MNFVDCTVLDEGGKTYLTFGEAKILLPDAKGRKPEVLSYAGKEVIMGIRPENIHDEEQFLSQHPESLVTMNVDVVEMMGAETYLYMNGEGRNFIARVEPRSTTKTGDTVPVAFDTKKVHLFDKETEKTITN